MLRRDFIQLSTLGAAGLLAAGSQAAMAKPIAIIDPEWFPSGQPGEVRRSEAASGAIAMLGESDLPYEVVSLKVDFSAYKVLVLPDNVLLTAPHQKKIETYLHQGGAVLASFRSGLSPDALRFASPAWGIELVGKARFSPDFITVEDKGLGAGMVPSELVMYLRGLEILPDSASVLARTLAPLPEASSYPAATRSGQVIYFMHPIFTQYHRTAPPWCRKLILNALDQLAQGVPSL